MKEEDIERAIENGFKVVVKKPGMPNKPYIGRIKKLSNGLQFEGQSGSEFITIFRVDYKEVFMI